MYLLDYFEKVLRIRIFKLVFLDKISGDFSQQFRTYHELDLVEHCSAFRSILSERALSFQSVRELL